MRDTRNFIIALLFVSATSAALGFVNGEFQATRGTQLAVAGCGQPGVECDFKKGTPKPKPGGGCPSSNTSIQVKCNAQKTIAAKQVTSGVGAPAPTVIKLEYTPSSCEVTTSVGGGACKVDASQTCPTAHANDKTTCFWTDCPATQCSAETKQEETKTESPLDSATSTEPKEEGGGEPPMPPPGGGGGEAPPPEEPPQDQCQIDPAGSGCPEEDMTEEGPPLEEDPSSEFDAAAAGDIEPGGDTAEEIGTTGEPNPAAAQDAQNPGGVVPETQETPDRESIPTRIAEALGQNAVFGGIVKNWLGVDGLAPTTPQPQDTGVPQDVAIVGNPQQSSGSDGFVRSAVTNFNNNVGTGFQAAVNSAINFVSSFFTNSPATVDPDGIQTAGIRG